MPFGVYESHSKYGSQLLPFICRRDTATNSVGYYKPHWHESVELLHCLAGEGNVIINGTVFEFKPDTTIIVNPNQIHVITSESKVQYDCIIIFDTFCRENGIYTDKYVFNSVIQSHQIGQLHLKMYEDFTNAEQAAKIRLDALDLLYNLQKNFTTEVLNKKETSVVEIKMAIEYINRNYQENITVDAVAKASNLSKYYFTKRFKEITGKTFIEFLNSVRCRRAADNLNLGKSVNEACFLSGFNDPAYFSRVFKKIMGVPPSKYMNEKVTRHPPQ